MSATSKLTTTQKESADVTNFGFWLYLLSDVMIFGSLFATYMVLRHNTAGGPTTMDIFEGPMVLLQTMLLLFSSFTAAMALSAAKHGMKKQLLAQLSFTGMLGLAFLIMELAEFSNLLSEGYSWQTSAFLSSFFALVGTHGLHITLGLIWLIVLLTVIIRRGLTPRTMVKLSSFVLFWHFLDLVWIGIFTIVYMFGLGVV